MRIDLGAICLESKLVTADMSVLEISLEPGADSGLHRHTRERETFHVLSGELQFFLEDQVMHAGPGETVSIPVGAVHRFRNEGTAQARALLLLNPGGLVQYFVELRALLDRQAAPEEIAPLNARYGLEFRAG
jgi:quercetin dioxygenase-like cupin family protein